MSNPHREIYEFDKFRLDISERILWREGEQLPLPEKAFETLRALIKRGNRLVGKDELLKEIWADVIVEENNLDKNISILRKALGEREGKRKFIETVRGHGFRFAAEVRKISEDTPPADKTAPEPLSSIPDSEFSELDQTVEPRTQAPAVGTANTRTERLYPRKLTRIWLVALLAVIVVGSVLLVQRFWRGSESPAASPIRSIAVLPFKPLVAENRNEALELGMADSLIRKLSGGEMIVSPINSVRRFAGLEQDSIAAGRELGVQAVLDGSIQTVGGQIRISASLVRTSDGKQLWGAQFDERSEDIFKVQDSISEKVVSALAIKLSSDARGRLTKRYTENVEAYESYLKGRFHQLKLTLPEAKLAVEFYNRTIEIDPAYALAYAGLADTYRSFALTSDLPASDTMPKAKAAALHAIEIDDSLAEAHAALGFVIFFYDWDWQAAEREYLRGLELNPNSSDTHQAYAVLLSSQGRHSEAIQEIAIARKLDPISQVSGAFEGFILTKAGRIDEARSTLTRSTETEPNFWLNHLFLSSADIEANMFDQAVVEARKAKELSMASTQSTAYVAFALAKSGKREEARSILNEMLNLSSERYVPAHNIALIYCALGENSKALDYLEKAYLERDARMVFLRVEPQWNNLRSEVRFKELIKKLALE